MNSTKCILCRQGKIAHIVESADYLERTKTNVLTIIDVLKTNGREVRKDDLVLFIHYREKRQ